MPLKLSLKPGEKFVLNGAVIVNGDKRTNLIIQNKASILRDKDIIQQEDANTPAKRIYFPVMMMYLDEENSQDYYDEFTMRMAEFMGAMDNPDILGVCVAVSKDVMCQDYYQALSKCRLLFEFEDERLSYVPEGVSKDATGHRESA